MLDIGFQAETEALDEYKWTALHFAALYGHAAIVDMLLHAKASSNAVDNLGDTLAQDAERNGHHDIAKRLREWQPGAASK